MFQIRFKKLFWNITSPCSFQRFRSKQFISFSKRHSCCSDYFNFYLTPTSIKTRLWKLIIRNKISKLNKSKPISEKMLLRSLISPKILLTFSLIADSRCLTTRFSESVFSNPRIFAESALTVAVAILIAVDCFLPSESTNVKTFKIMITLFLCANGTLCPS